MRISETQLRRMVRQAINEMPLRNLSPMRRLDDEPSSDAKKVGKIYSSPNFVKKLTNFLSSWNTNFYVAPLQGYLSFNDRFDISPFDEFVEKHKNVPAIAEALQEYAASADPDNDCLIIPMGIEAPNIEVGLTPWMIFHAMFDTEDHNAEELFPTANEIGNLVMRSVEAIGKDLNELNPEVARSISRSGKFEEMIEKIFTFGSARAKYFTKVAEGDLRDLENESSVQSLLKNGFTYNPKAIDDFGKLVPGFDVQKWKAKFDQIAAMSPMAKREADSNMRGMVALVQVH